MQAYIAFCKNSNNFLKVVDVVHDRDDLSFVPSKRLKSQGSFHFLLIVKVAKARSTIPTREGEARKNK